MYATLSVVLFLMSGLYLNLIDLCIQDVYTCMCVHAWNGMESLVAGSRNDTISDLYLVIEIAADGNEEVSHPFLMVVHAHSVMVDLEVLGALMVDLEVLGGVIP